MTPRGAIAGHGGRLKLIFRTDNCKRLGVHCLGDDGTTTLTGHVVDQAELFGLFGRLRDLGGCCSGSS
jgi:hypothetical protein